MLILLFISAYFLLGFGGGKYARCCVMKMDMYDVFRFEHVNKSPDVSVGLSDTSSERVMPAFYGVGCSWQIIYHPIVNTPKFMLVNRRSPNTITLLANIICREVVYNWNFAIATDLTKSIGYRVLVIDVL